MASDLVRQMLEGLAYLHSEGVCLYITKKTRKSIHILFSIIDCSPRYQAENVSYENTFAKKSSFNFSL